MTMKKLVKILLIIMVASFSLASIIVMENGGMRFFDLEGNHLGVTFNEPQGNKVMIQGQTFLTGVENELNVESPFGDVIVKRGTDKALTARMVGNFNVSGKEKPELSVFKEGKAIFVETRREVSNGLLETDSVKLEITVPESYHGNLSVSARSGDVEIWGGEFKNSRIHAESGDVETGFKATERLKVVAESGDVDVDLKDIKDYNADVKTESGELHLEAAPEVSLTEDQTAIQYKKGTGQTLVRIEAKSGDITLK